MRIKTIIILILILLFTILIYYTNQDEKIYYLNITDTEFPYSNYILNILNKNKKLEKYVNSFSEDDIRITDLINNIENNKMVKIKNKNVSLKNALIKSDLVTLSIGNSYLYYKLNYENEENLYDYVDELLSDYEILLPIIKKYCKEKIVIIGYNYTNDENKKVINYFNKRLEELCNKYNIEYVENNKNTKLKIEKIVENLI